MKTKFKLRVLFFALCFAFFIAATAAAQEQCDFDGDLVSDYLTLSSNGTTLIWNTLLSSDSTIQSTTFGQSDDYPVPANWDDEFSASLGVVRIGKKDELIWKLYLSSGLIEEKTFGKSGQVIMSGADFDGNGISDAAVVERKNDTLKWTIRLNLFYGEGQRTVSFRHGIVGDRVFYLSPEGAGDWAGVFGRDKKGRAVMSLRNVITKEKISIRKINRKFTTGDRPRPFPIKSSDGTDVIGYVTTDGSGKDTVLSVYNLDGSILNKRTLNGLGTFLVGNYNAESEGEEVLFQIAGKNIIYNPFEQSSEETSAVSATAIDQIVVQSVSAPTPVPTATPQVTATFTATSTPTQTPG